MPIKKERKTVMVACAECGKEVEQREDHARRSKLNFCSMKCANIHTGRIKTERAKTELTLVLDGKIESKICKRCGKLKSFNEYAKSPTEKFGLRSKCKECQKELRRSPENKKYRKEKNLEKYGLNIETYKLLYERQAGKCAICGKNKKLVIDHDHLYDEVRGLLCHQCNIGIGMFHERPEIMIKAIEYIGKAHRISGETSHG